MKLLISAFEPFGGDSQNASMEALKLLRPPQGIELETLCLPVEFGTAGERLKAHIKETVPDAVVCLGQAAGRAAITPERVAINLRDASIPDNAGRQPKDEPCVPGAPTAYFSTLPVKQMVRRAAALGLPAAVSHTAGTFVCNDLFFSLMHLTATAYPGLRAGFIHLPCLPEQAERLGLNASLPCEEAACGLEAMLTALTEE